MSEATGGEVDTGCEPWPLVTVEKHVLGDLAANAKRWQNRAHTMRKKRRRWENERLREALSLIADGLSGVSGVSPAAALGLESIARFALETHREGSA